MLFRNNTLGRGGGLTIGSEGSGGVYNVTFQNLTLNGTSCAVHIKSRPSRGGVYDGIFFKDIVAHNVYKLFDVNMGGTCRSNTSGFCSDSTRPQLNNVVVENVRFTADAHVTNHSECRYYCFINSRDCLCYRAWLTRKLSPPFSAAAQRCFRRLRRNCFWGPERH